MQIYFVENKNIDKEKWDQCIEESYNGTIYAMSWYLDVSSDYWDALIFGNYEIVFPIPYTKKFGFRILRQPAGSQQLGIFSKEDLTEKIIIQFLKAIPKKFLFGKLHLNAGNKILSSKEFPVKYAVNIELNLTSGIEELRKNYSSSIIRNLKRSSKNQITINKGDNIERILNIFKETKGKDFGVHENYYKIAFKIFNELKERQQLIIYDAYDESGTFIVGLILAPFMNKMYILFAGSTQKSYEIYANHLLYDYAIQEASKTKKILDFEGSNTKSLAFVYHGFGGETVPYPVVTISNIPRFLLKFISLLKKDLI